MSEGSRIAVVGFSTLESLGIMSLLRDADVSAVRFSTFSELEPLAGGFDAYITDAGSLVANIGFFLPRRKKTLVLGDSFPAGEDDNSFRIAPATVCADEISSSLESFVESVGEKVDDGGLSEREKDVIRGVASGYTNKEIADMLCISVNTVITHRKNIASKLGIKSASGISLYALMHGIITT